MPRRRPFSTLRPGATVDLRATTSVEQVGERKDILLSGYSPSWAGGGSYFGGYSMVTGVPGRSWSMQRAVKEGMSRDVYLYRAVKTIAMDQSRLRFGIREGDLLSPDWQFGPELTDDPLLPLLNVRANPVELAYQLRERVSMIWCLSPRGGFIEAEMTKGKRITALKLLPTMRTHVVPDSSGNIKNFRVDKPYGMGPPRTLDPDQVLWFREPHPDDPFVGLTALEAAGLDIEVDYFARLFNRQFLANDGRPGGIVAVTGPDGPKGQAADEEELERVERRLGGGPVDAGRFVVIDGTVQFIDTSGTPRDAQWQQARQMSKLNELGALGVPESVALMNATNSTFANSGQEWTNYWVHTQAPHSDAFALLFIDRVSGVPFLDYSKVEALQGPVRDRRAEMRDEALQGLRTPKAYALATGQKVGNDPDDDMPDVPATRSLWLTAAGKVPVAPNEEDQAEVDKLTPIGGGQAPPGGPDGAPPGGDQGGGDPFADLPAEYGGGPPNGNGNGTAAYDSNLKAIVAARVASRRRAGIKALTTAAKRGMREPDDEEDHRAARCEADLRRALTKTVNGLVADTLRSLATVRVRAGTRVGSAGGTKQLDTGQLVDQQAWEDRVAAATAPYLAAAAAQQQTTQAQVEADAGRTLAEVAVGTAAGGVAGAAAVAVPGLAAAQAARLSADLLGELPHVVGFLAGSARGRAEDLVAAIAEAENEETARVAGGGAPAGTAAINRAVREWAAGLRGWIDRVAPASARQAVEAGKHAVLGRLGNRVERWWLSRRDDKVRPTHKAADGQVQSAGSPFVVGDALLRYPRDPLGPPGETINCFPGDVLVRAGDAVGSYRRWYEGRLVRIELASGNVLAATPNHPVLTERGWVPVGELEKGDYLVRALDGDAGAGGREPHVEDAPTPIAEVFHALAMAGDCSRERGSSVDFHGDGTDGEVEVVTTDRALRHGGDPAAGQENLKGDFPDAGLSAGSLSTTSSRGEGGLGLDVVGPAGAGGVRSEGKAAPFVDGRAGHADGHRSTPPAWLETALQKDAPEGAAAHPEAARDRLLRLTGEVSTDRVVRVVEDEWRGHVYNLETRSGIYAANRLIAGNCRCRTRWRLRREQKRLELGPFDVVAAVLEQKKVHHVRTPAGSRYYHLPVGSPIEARTAAAAAARVAAAARAQGRVDHVAEIVASREPWRAPTRPASGLIGEDGDLAELAWGVEREEALSSVESFLLGGLEGRDEHGVPTFGPGTDPRGGNPHLITDEEAVAAKQEVMVDLERRMAGVDDAALIADDVAAFTDSHTFPAKTLLEMLNNPKLLWKYDDYRETWQPQTDAGIGDKEKAAIRSGDPRRLAEFGYGHDVGVRIRYGGPLMVKEARLHAVRRLVGTWAATSNDSHAGALAMQRAVADEFGLPEVPFAEKQPEEMTRWVDELYARHGELYRAFARAQYDATQERLKAAGLTSVRLYRGVHLWTEVGVPTWAQFAHGTNVEVPLRPASSFTANPDTAVDFASAGMADQRVVLVADVPAERILGTPRTGVGCLNEWEFVVLAGAGRFAVYAEGDKVGSPDEIYERADMERAIGRVVGDATPEGRDRLRALARRAVELGFGGLLPTSYWTDRMYEKALAPAGRWPDTLNEDWIKTLSWDVRGGDDRPVATLGQLAAVLRVTEAQAAEWVATMPAGQAAPDAIRRAKPESKARPHHVRTREGEHLFHLPIGALIRRREHHDDPVEAAVGVAADARAGGRRDHVAEVVAAAAPKEKLPAALRKRVADMRAEYGWTAAETRGWPARAVDYYADDDEFMVLDDRGVPHYGEHGAAGALLRNVDGHGTTRYLLQRRSGLVQHGGTWSTPGGALHAGETPAAGAAREVQEELGADPSDLRHVSTHTADMGGWAYHTVVLDVPDRDAIAETADASGSWESDGIGWFTAAEVDELNLHPGFAASWAGVRRPEPVGGLADAYDAMFHLFGNAPGTVAGDTARAKADLAEQHKTVLDLVDGGMDPEKAAKEYARLLNNLRDKYRRDRVKAAKAAAAAAGKAVTADKADDAPKGDLADVADELLKNDAVDLDKALAGVADSAGKPKALYDANGSLGPGAAKPGGKAWFDLLSEDTTEPVPVVGLTIEGHTVEHGWAIRVAGRSYLIETAGPVPADDAMGKARFDNARQVYDAVMAGVPEAAAHQHRQRGVAMLLGKNPKDAYWAQQYGKPGFTSGATGGNGGTTFWGATPPTPGLVAHEFGHNLDRTLFWSGSVSSATAPKLHGQTRTWSEAFADDARTQLAWGEHAEHSDLAGRFVQTRVGIDHPITAGAQSPTEYAQAAPTEDFAESVRLYLKDRREGKLGYVKPENIGTGELGANVRFADLWPERARILDAAFGTTSDYDTAFHKRQVAAAVAGVAKDPGAFTAVNDVMRTFGLDRPSASSALDEGSKQWAAAQTEKAKADALAWLEANKWPTVPIPAQQAATVDHLTDAYGLSGADATAIVDNVVAKMTAAEAAKQHAAENAKAAQDVKDAEAQLADTSALPESVLLRIRHSRTDVKSRAKKKGASPEEAEALAAAWEQKALAKAFAKYGLSGQVFTEAPKKGKTTGQTVVAVQSVVDPKWDEPAHKRAEAFVTESGLVPAHGTVKQLGPPQQAKANIAATLAAMLNNEQDWEIFRAYKASGSGSGYSAYDYSDKADLPAFHYIDMNERQKLLDAECSRRIQNWASTSADTNPFAIMMQRAAAEEFGLTGGHGGGKGGKMKEVVDARYPQLEKFYKRFLRVMYDNTQAELEKANLEWVPLYRGMKLAPLASGGRKWATKGVHEVPLRALSSFAAAQQTARNFSGGKMLMRGMVHRSHIIGTARTGFGCRGEYEFVVMAPPKGGALWQVTQLGSAHYYNSAYQPDFPDEAEVEAAKHG